MGDKRPDIEEWVDALRAFAKLTKDLPNDTEVSLINAKSEIEIVPDLIDKVMTARKAKMVLEKIVRSKGKGKVKARARRIYGREIHQRAAPRDRHTLRD